MCSISFYTALQCETMNSRFLREFCETTTFDGFPHWYKDKNTGWKIVWSVVIGLGFATTAVEIWKVFDDYQNKPISTYYQIKQPNDGVDFPDMVICNPNIVNSSKVKENNLSAEIVNSVLAMFLNDNRMELLKTLYPSSAFHPNDQLDEKLSKLNDSSIKSILMSISYDQKKFIIACFFQKVPCHFKNISISTVRDAEYGICFLIEVHHSQYMPRGGLTLFLDVHSELWWTPMPAFTSGVSLKIDKKYDPLSLKNLHLSSGTYSQISLYLVHHKLYDDGSNSSCYNDMDRKILNTTYSVELCRSECFLKKLYKICACIPSITRDQLLNDRIPYCITTKQQSCLSQVMSSGEIRNSIANCSRNCLPKCEYWSFSSTVSTKKFPARGLKSVLTGLNNISMDEKRLEDYMLLDVSFEQIQVSMQHAQCRQSSRVKYLGRYLKIKTRKIF